MGNFTPAGIEYLVKNFSKGMSDLNKLDKSQQNLGKSAGSAAKQFTGLGKGVLSVGAIAGGAAVAGVGALGVAVGGLGVASVKTAISFESAFAGVLKTTDGLTDSIGNLNIAGQDLREGFVDLSKEAPLAFEELAQIGELGGQLGIGKDALIEFTESVAALGVSTNLSTEEAASGLARMSNIFNVSSEDMGNNITRLGSSIVDLGNNFATTERDILAFAERVAGAGAIAGLSQADILGIGAAMSSVGVQAEAGGTAVQKVLLAINGAVVGTTTGFVDNTKAIEENINRLTSLNGKLVALESKAGLTGEQILQMRDEFIAAGGSAEEFGRQLGATERRQLFDTAIAIRDLKDETELLRELQGQPIDAGQLETFAKTAGLSAEEFREAWETDASSAFQLFVEGLGKQGDDAINTLEELGLTDQRLIRAFLSLSGAGNLLGETLDTANSAFEENTALADEAAKRYATTESQLLILKNTIRAIGDAIGSRFLPFLNKLIKSGKDLVNKFADPIAQAIDEKVIPAIDGIIKLGSDLFAAFQAGGTGGLVEALGLTPETTELISKISQAFMDLGIALGIMAEPEIVSISGIGDFDVSQSPLVTGLMFLKDNILPAINTAIAFVNLNFEAFKGAIIGVGAVLAGAAIAATLAGIATAIGTILSPIGLLIIAAAAIGAAWATNWMGIREITATVIATITEIVMALVQTFQTTVVPPLQNAFNNLTQVLNQLGLDWGDVWNAVLEAIKIVAIGIGIAIGLVITTIGGLVTGIATALEVATRFIDDFGIGFKNIIEGIATALVGWQTLFQGIMGGGWAMIWEGATQILQGTFQVWTGLFQNLITTIQAALSTMLGFIVGFAQGVIAVFTDLSNVLVGNSIIPDMVNAIVETFKMMIEPILTVFTTLSDSITGLLGSLFGGGAEGLDLDITSLTEALPAAIQLVGEALEKLRLMFSAINEQISVLLPKSVIVFTEMFLESFLQMITLLTQTSMILLEMATVLFPELSIAADATIQIIIRGFQRVNQVMSITNALLLRMSASFKQMGEAAKEAVKNILKVEKAIAPLERLISVVKRATDAFKAMAAAAKSAAGAASNAGQESGAAGGLGFQAGTSPRGFMVPGPRDAPFPITVHGGERVFVESVSKVGTIGSTNVQTFNITNNFISQGTMSEAQSVLIMRQNLQRQLSMV